MEHYFPESPRVLPLELRDVEIMEYLNLDWKPYVYEEGKTVVPFEELRRRIDKVTDEELNNWKKKKTMIL